MAVILSIETATAVCSVAVFKDTSLLSHLQLNEGRDHATRLAPLIKDVMQQANLQSADLDAVAVSIGPGSYTGLRIGLVTAKGICFAIDKPLIGVNTLAAMAAYWFHQHPDRMDVIACPMIDARRLEVYTAMYDSSMNELMPASAVVMDQHQMDTIEPLLKKVVFGDGHIKSRVFLSSAIFEADANTDCSAVGVGLLALQQYNNQDFMDLKLSTPFYMKEVRITTPKKRSE